MLQDAPALAAEFARCLPEGQTAPARSAIEHAVGARLALGRAAWPDIELEPVVFVRWLATRTVDGRLPAEAYSADLYLACACAARVSGALEAFERSFFHHAERAVARVERRPSFVDDTLQTLREKLFVGRAGSPPKIAEYAGRASLAAWLSAVGIRAALNLRRNLDQAEHEELSSGAVGVVAPELDYIRQKYKVEFESAVRSAFSGLGDRDRALLRLHYANRLGIDHLGRLYKVGRSTAHRWLESARRSLLEATLTTLRERLGITKSEFDSLAQLVASDIEISFLRALDPTSL